MNQRMGPMAATNNPDTGDEPLDAYSFMADDVEPGDSARYDMQVRRYEQDVDTANDDT